MANQVHERDMTLPTTLDDFGQIRIGIHQTEYSTGAGFEIPVIHIFGRDLSGKAVRVDVTGFRPYFYAPADQVDGKPLPEGG